MRIKMFRLLFIVCILYGPIGEAKVPAIDALFDRLEGENSEIRFSNLNEKSHEQNLKAAQSLLYPSLSLVGGVAKGSNLDLNTSANVQNPNVLLGNQTSSINLPINYSQSVSGWNLGLATQYYLFAHFAIDGAIQAAKISIESARLELSKEKLIKRSQLLQLILEWQWLNSMVSPLEEAKRISDQVNEYAQRKSYVLYSDDERLELRQRTSEIKYNWLKVTGGLKVVETAIKDAVPSFGQEELKHLPRIALEYETPSEEELNSKYIKSSISRQVENNNVLIATSNYRTYKWSKPWIPIVLLNASSSRYGDTSGNSSNNSWSVGLLLSFELFDGFYTESRREQSWINLAASEEKRKIDTNKKGVFLQSERVKVLVSKAEFDLKELIAERKKMRLKDSNKKRSQGVGTKLESSLFALDFVKEQLDALDALKNYQSAALDIAVELNEWEKVNIYEIH